MHPMLALWLALAMLSVKLLVPAGFMVGVVNGHVGLQICSGFAPAAAMPMAHHAMAHGSASIDAARDHGKADHPAAEMPCPFATLTHGAAVPVDPILLAMALAFALVLGFALIVRRGPRAVPFLRPPLRGPPLPA